MSGFTGSSKAMACRETGVMPVWLVKGCTAVIARYGGDCSVQAEKAQGG